MNKMSKLMLGAIVSGLVAGTVARAEAGDDSGADKPKKSADMKKMKAGKGKKKCHSCSGEGGDKKEGGGE